jgi:hypothetical protein
MTSTTWPGTPTRHSARARRATSSSRRAYDDAFAAFFQRLAGDGINRGNTLFVFTVDEGDHFVGGSPTPASCDGVSAPCDWTGQVGELNANIDTLFANQYPALAPLWLGAAAERVQGAR